MKKVVLIILLLFPIFIYAKEEVKFNACVDGDTIKVIRKKEKITVRLLAIDTPEVNKKEYYSKEASDYTCKLIKNANKIELEYDSKSQKEDKYGRVLAWVYVDDILLEEDLVEKGYAKVAYVYDDYKYVNLLRKKEYNAKKENLGVWKDKKNINTDMFVLYITIFIFSLIVIYILFKDKLKNKKNRRKIKRVLKILRRKYGKSL